MADENKELTREELEQKFKEKFIGGVKVGRRFEFDGDEYIPVRENDNVSSVLQHYHGDVYSFSGIYDHQADRFYTYGRSFARNLGSGMRYDDFCGSLDEAENKTKTEIKEHILSGLKPADANDENVLEIIKETLFRDGFMKIERREEAAVQEYVDNMEISLKSLINYIDQPDAAITGITDEIPNFNQIKADSDKCNSLVENGLVTQFAEDLYGEDLEEIRMAHDLSEALEDKATVSVTFSALFSEKTGKADIVIDGFQADDSIQTITYDGLSARELKSYLSDYTRDIGWEPAGEFHKASIGRQIPVFEGADGKITVKPDAGAKQCIGQIKLTVGDIQSISYRKKEIYSRDNYPDSTTGQDAIKAILTEKSKAQEQAPVRTETVTENKAEPKTEQKHKYRGR